MKLSVLFHKDDVILERSLPDLRAWKGGRVLAEYCLQTAYLLAQIGRPLRKLAFDVLGNELNGDLANFRLQGSCDHGLLVYLPRCQTQGR